MNVNIEIFIDGCWQTARVFSADEKSIKYGIACSGTFEYDIDYTVAQLDNRPERRVGLNYPISFELFLSPLFDFAPMFLDPEGIPRSSRWEGELEPVIGRPSWRLITRALAFVIDQEELSAALLKDAEAVATLPETMKECGVEDKIIDRVANRCAEISDDLLQMKG
jgi:hypothetical protein